tara:strand:- start:322 stop:516 length:195 start_codon:yes stop_codon:yes gene_type:complete
MTDIRALFEQAKDELENEQPSPTDAALAALIRGERRNFYASGSKHGKLIEVKKILAEHAGTWIE